MSDLVAKHDIARTKRAEIRRKAQEMGIDEAYLSQMVETFYDRVRQDARLGPIFVREVEDDWTPHLEKMKSFWASVALSSGTYSGKPVLVHQRLEGVRKDDMARWLRLFRATLDDTAPTPEAAEYLMERAQRIASSLEMAMFPCLGNADGPPDLRSGLS
ncbi:group III truncated hemoglobin [Tranquillimonas alkanivorans]|uniref:Hemoglobin n=1 Tax=Tranquillimonas alkanivorans TaxID=441119 RepID=A0A1I5WRY8_9RHOB|nr:group III truncated hemoglobin [Tranquillimonas alkanivorans]SFQ22470.1 hemoglobin [Tranquillimonas alkanivorans]